MLAAVGASACSRRAHTAPGAEASLGETPLREMSVNDVWRHVEASDPSFAVFDANGRARYERGHVPGARWVSADRVAPQVLPADRSKLLVFYCANEH